MVCLIFSLSKARQEKKKKIMQPNGQKRSHSQNFLLKYLENLENFEKKSTSTKKK